MTRKELLNEIKAYQTKFKELSINFFQHGHEKNEHSESLFRI